MEINNLLLAWYDKNKRDLAWRDTTDPYKIWLSEILLQQTRVQQGLPYYVKFVNHYPTIFDLASASEQEVLSLWQGLGYYSRARNMHKTAIEIVENRNGQFPNTYDEIISLKGVGEYTAAAIASFAFDLPHAVLDGNVYRVISRLYNISKPINKPSGHKAVREILDLVFDKKRPAKWNQAIMEFGSLHCTPKKPKCEECIFRINCQALAANTIDQIPYKEGKTKVKDVYHGYFPINFGDKTYIEKRENGIWKNLFQFPLVEENLGPTEAIKYLKSLIINNPKIELSEIIEEKHILSHRRIYAKFYTLHLDSEPIFSKSNIFEIEKNDLGTIYPTSVLTLKYLDQNNSDDK